MPSGALSEVDAAYVGKSSLIVQQLRVNQPLPLDAIYHLIYQRFMLFSPAQLQQLRRSTGLSRERFAHLIGVSLASVNRWESGSSSPSGTALAIYETINAALARRANVAKIAEEAEVKGTPFFLYKLSNAAFG